MKSPAFQFYPTDYLGSQRVQMMTLEEEGAYVRLLCSCWQHGSIPTDPEQAARLVGKGASTTLVSAVLSMFQPGEPGRLIHDRLESERTKQATWREKSAEGGRKSAELRKGGSRVVQPPYQPKGNTPSPSPSPSPSPITLPLPTTKADGHARALPDAEWLASLKVDPAYEGIDVDREVAKCARWCETKRKPAPGRARIVNWLNRCERPVNGTSAGGAAVPWQRDSHGQHSEKF